jgi:hypothetical protein
MFDETKWRARDDLSTLSRAAEIAADRQRLSAARAEAKKQMKSLATVAGGQRQRRRTRLEDVEL